MYQNILLLFIENKGWGKVQLFRSNMRNALPVVIVYYYIKHNVHGKETWENSKT